MMQGFRKRNRLTTGILLAILSLGGLCAGPLSASAPPLPYLSCAWRNDLSPLWQRVYNAKTSASLPAHPVGDGAANDLPAIQADEIWISQYGGGVLYLPAGTYRLDNTSNALVMYGNAPIEGDGPTSTVLTYGASNTPGSNGVLWNCPSLGGFYNLGLRNVCPPDVSPWDTHALTQNCRDANSGAVQSKVFLKNVAWDLGYGDKLYFYNYNHLDIEDCQIDGTKANHGAVWFEHDTDIALYRNYIHYKSGRFAIVRSTSITLTGNTLARDGGIHTPQVESGGIACCSDQGVTITNNLVTTLGTLDKTNNDGECFLSQTQGDTSHFYDVGQAWFVGATTLTDSTRSWSQNWGDGTIILMTSGAALGQWRYVVSHTITQVTVDRPWDTAATPKAGDQYAITTWNLKDVTIANNKFVNNPKSIMIADGGLNVAIVGNTLVDSGGIIAYGRDYDSTYPNWHEAIWNCRMTNNNISNPAGLNLSYIGVIGAQINTMSHGNLTLGNVVMSNSLTPHPAGTFPILDAPGVIGDGIYCKVMPYGRDPSVIGDILFPGTTNGQ